MKKTWPIWIAATIALTAVFHILTILALPYGIMDRAMAGISGQAGGVNKPLYPDQPTAESRSIVRPSPDLLYTACAYDVSDRPLKLTSPVPDTYWSLSAFAANTDNFFVVNDRQANNKKVEIILATDKNDALSSNIPVVITPTTKGIVLFRSLVSSEDERARIDSLRRQSNCEPL